MLKIKTKEKFNFLFYFLCRFVIVTSDCNTNLELVQQNKKNIASNDRAYHSTEIIDEALKPPWALDYEIKRRPATPNLQTNSTDSTYN